MSCENLKPRDSAEVEQAIRWALAGGKTFELVGHGSKRAIGCPAQTDATLDLSGLAGVMLYEPEELVLSAKAGTALAEIEALLASKGQHLPFEPIDYGPLFGEQAGRGTIGGALAANVSGPRRIRAGAARDHLLGIVAMSGRGETFRSGGRVVKNVTGYDLCKLMAGSWGTLAALTDVTIKVLPRPPAEATLVAFGLDDETAAAAMAKAMGSTAGVSGAAHLPDYVASRFDGLAPRAEAVTVLRIEGIAAGIADAIAALRNAVPPFASGAVLDEVESRALWRAIRDVRAFWSGTEAGDRALWRVSTAPSKGFEIAGKISPAAHVFYDWAGGLLWIAPPEAPDCRAGEIRAAVAASGGHATLVRAPAAVRASVGAFAPEAGALAALTRRVKEGFDPQGVLNPGRMWAGV
jgi:glycolate oxidase FAD binding subunit